MEPALTIGVMGSASGQYSPEVLQRCTVLGRTIAENGYTLITGACPGLSLAAVEGARAAGGLVVGISPGFLARSTLRNTGLRLKASTSSFTRVRASWVERSRTFAHQT
jgi:uncharacterized protein (TIGR00725 family)